MATDEFDKDYAAARVADIDARIETLKVESDALTAERERYADKPKRTRAKSDDKS